MSTKSEKWIELNKLLGFKAPLDGVLSALAKRVVLDLPALDNEIGNRVPEYDAENCLYKGKPASMKEVITQYYGERAAQLIGELM